MTVNIIRSEQWRTDGKQIEI